MVKMNKVVGSLIPQRMMPRVTRIYARLKLAALRLFASTDVLAGLHYTFVSRQFCREHRAVLSGRIAYQQALVEIGKTSALLRRNIHRLEKGLIMRPRRDVFGEGFIRETVECFSRAVATPDYSTEELRWARDVLETYFEAVTLTPTIGAAKVRFVETMSFASDSECPLSQRYVPYPRHSTPATTISYNQLLTLFRRRRSVRWYQDRPVSKEDLIRMVHAAALAPSACNRQPFRFLIADSSDTATEIAKCAGGTIGFADNLQALVVIVGDLSSYPSERDRHLIYIDASSAAMQMMLSAETLGLSTCPINWPDLEGAEGKIARLLPLPSYQRVIMLMAVGYADPSGGIPYSCKKSPADLVDFVTRVAEQQPYRFTGVSQGLSGSLAE